MQKSIRTFYALVITQTFSIIGSQMSGFAIGIKVFDDTGQATPLALVAFFAIVPQLIGTSVAGVLADRMDRKKLMIFSDAGQALATAILLVSFASGWFELWHLYVIVALQALFGVFQHPAFAATVTLLVPDEERDRANTIQQLTRPAAGIVAPVVAGFLYAIIDVTGIMVIDLFTFGVAVFVLSMMHIPNPERTEEGQASRGNMLKEAWSGFQFLLDRRMLFYLICYATLLNFLFNMAMTLNTPYVLLLTDSASTLGIVMASMATGMIVGGVAFSMWKRNIERIHVIFISIISMGLMMALYGLARSPVALIGVIFFAMMLNPAINATLMSLMQIKTPPDMQGRVFAAVSQLAMLATPIAYLITGPLADQVLEPGVKNGQLAALAPLIGDKAGSGIGLLMFINGMLVVMTGIILYSSKRMRAMEETLPDYRIPVEESDEQHASTSPSEATLPDLAGVNAAPID